MKVFLSHQMADAAVAGRIQQKLATYRIESYLDVTDPTLFVHGEDLASHIRDHMGSCTQLLAVVSENTKLSQWVPWEVGVASEKEMPLATFASDKNYIPEFLRRWPYLLSMSDIDLYAASSQTADLYKRTKRGTITEARLQSNATNDYYRTLRSRLGQ